MNRSGVIQDSSEWLEETAHRPASADERRTHRVRSWRRRVLQRRGALMHAAMARGSENSSLAMLDETGMVVSWHAQGGAPGEHVVDRHVSQFYLPGQIASNQPIRDLRSAAVGGSITRQGWRRRADGTTFWGNVVIEAVVLRDGRLQGFSYVMGTSNARIPRRVSCLTPLLLGLCLCAALPVVAGPNELPDHAGAGIPVAFGGNANGVSVRKMLHAWPCSFLPTLTSITRATLGRATRGFTPAGPFVWRIDGADLTTAP